MRLRKEDFFESGIYHIYNRAVAKELLFRQDEDYLQFLHKLKTSSCKIPVSILAYCLMPNHFHFLLKQKSNIPIYKIFNRIGSSFVQWYNHKYDRRGKLFAGKLQHKFIKTDGYLIQLTKYIHANPVKANLVADLCSWKYSNYPEFLGLRKGTLCDRKYISFVIDLYPNYADTIFDYLQYNQDKKFRDLLIDG